MATIKSRRIKLTALIIVGEGAQDKAFLSHMKVLYDRRETGQVVKVDSSDGGSPADIIKTTIRKYKHADYDRRYVLVDTDVTIRQQDWDAARKAKIELIVSAPICLEGMLLEVLGQAVPDSSIGCKNALHPQLAGNPNRRDSYANIFTKKILDVTTKEQIARLRGIISNSE